MTVGPTLRAARRRIGGSMMDIRFAVTPEKANVVRSGIYAFVSSLEDRPFDGGFFFCLTTIPIEDAWEYHLNFADVQEGERFLAMLPSLFPAGPPAYEIDG
jgi:hypothetical protein